MTERAIILAAGQGRRLWPYTEHAPKCLLNVGGKSIAEHQVEALFSQGVRRITVVTGYLGEKIQEILGEKVEYIRNERFEETSSMYSLWLAREMMKGGFLAVNGDVLFHVGILKSLLSCPHPDALAVDLEATLAEEEMRVSVRDGRVLALSKTLHEPDGENVGMLKFSAEGGRVLLAKIEEILKQGLQDKMIPYAVDAIAPSYPLAAVPVSGLPWIEIDFPEDYQRAQEVIYPAIIRNRKSPSHDLADA
jgi:choline kinase